MSQRRPSNPPHRYHWLKAKSMRSSFVGVAGSVTRAYVIGRDVSQVLAL